MQTQQAQSGRPVPNAKQYDRPRFTPLDKKFTYQGLEREVHRHPKGFECIFTPANRIVPLDRAKLEEAGQFRRPTEIVKTEKRPTGHQPPKVKQNGGKKNKNGKHKR